MTALRVLSTFEYGSLHGGEQSWLAVSRLLPEHGVQPIALAPPDSPLAEGIASLGVTCLPLRLERRQQPDDAQLLEQLQRAVRQQAIDLIHANSLSMARRIGRIAGELSRPAVGHVRDIIRLSGKAVRDVSANAGLFAVSEATRRQHVAQGVPEDRINVLYNGVDLERFRPGDQHAARMDLGIPADAFVVISIGQIGMRKGLDAAAAAIAAAARQCPRLVWLVVGQRFSEKQEAVDYELQLRETAERIGPERVRFLGVRDDVPNLLAASDVLLHAARQEPLGRVLLEAAASGTAIVATDVGGTPEIVEDGRSAILVPADSIDDLANALVRLRNDVGMRANLAKQARLTMKDRFDHRRAARDFAEALQAHA